jgi:hypothetical protein
MSEEALKAVQEAQSKARRMVSPNDLHSAALAEYCGGNQPKNNLEWAKIAVAEVEACKLMALMFDCPIPVGEIEKIAKFQMERK